VLQRRLGLRLEQPPDVDALLPQQRMALFLTGGWRAGLRQPLAALLLAAGQQSTAGMGQARHCNTAGHLAGHLEPATGHLEAPPLRSHDDCSTHDLACRWQ